MEFNFLLDKNLENNLSLKSLLSQNIKDINLDIKYKININIKDNLNINLIDDLFDLNLFNSEIYFILNNNSVLNYILKTDVLHNCEYFCKKCLKNKNINNIYKKIHVNLLGQNSNADLKIAYNGAGNNLLNIETIQEHNASQTKSNLIIKSALSQFAKLYSDNLIKVNKDLIAINANQDTKSLMFGCSSIALIKPKLEVESQDVICKHGAAASRLNENQLFYLESRGINYCEAKDLLINSFLN
ncbi:SufD family Fe-S cluster assembly protein [Candidatus Dependentiae bacterium]|nr:SufD family Fe-S cluster assembly protein [Candidatus Dependentiae bacterium]MBU4387151.1 SufD family Fe-S cluster assembly protein [Candidatus Dependentiae bacterium]MCG2756736.1 SufD family Fe-S cluster assembly protein [Candidatus Dependentiae bacterium]